MSRTAPVPSVNTLPETIANRLNLYSLAAATAGVSMLALAQPAEGTVVIKNKKIPIPLCTVFDPCSVSIDLNGDGVNDFKFSLISSYGMTHATLRLSVAPHHGGGVMGTAGGKHGPYASALLRGAKIGASDHFLSGGKDAVEQSDFASSSGRYSRTFYGKWGGDHPNRFLGVKFLIKGATHYGWIRMTVDTKACCTISATITEYGYETIANKSLGAGLPGANPADAQARETGESLGRASLGVLALGADGLALWRREKELVH